MGSAYDDELTGNGGNNVSSWAVDGDDEITGGLGADTVEGGAGADELDGGVPNLTDNEALVVIPVLCEFGRRRHGEPGYSQGFRRSRYGRHHCDC